MHRILPAALLCMFALCLPIAPAAHATPSLPRPAPKPAYPRATAVSPSCTNDTAIGGKIWTVAISDTLAFLGDGRALTILDVSDPARPSCRSHLALPANIAVLAVQVHGTYAYLALNNTNASGAALQIVDVHDPDNPSLMGSYSASNASDLAVMGNLVYLSTAQGISIIDVGDPTTPKLAGTYVPGSFGSLQIDGSRLYVNGPGTSFDILDLANPLQPVRLGGMCNCTGGPIWLSFSVAGSLAYMLRSAGGVDVLDISSPSNAQLVGTYTNIDFLDGHFHPFTKGLKVIGNRLYIADTRFQIYDVSSLTKAVLIGSYDAPGAGYDMWLAGDLAYVGNPENGLQTGDYGFEVMDLSNQVNPFLRGWFHSGNTGRFFYMSSIQR